MFFVSLLPGIRYLHPKWMDQRGLRKWEIPITGFYYRLLRFITVYYGVLFRILRYFSKAFYWLWTKTPPKKSPQNSNFRENHGKNRTDLLQILRDITDITEIAISEYYRILWSVISPPWMDVTFQGEGVTN